MPVLIPEPRDTAEVRPFWEAEDTPVSQGVEGQQMREQIQLVSNHWRQQSLGVLASDAPDLLDELRQYHHVPFETVGKIRVRFNGITDLRPRKFDFDGDVE